MPEPKTMTFLPGSIEVEHNEHFLAIAPIIGRAMKGYHGYYGYKFTSLGRSSDDEAPTFLAMTREFGVLLIDVIEERLVAQHDVDSDIVWEYESGTQAYSREVLMGLFEEEVQSRLKNDLTLYDRKTRKLKVPVKTILVFCNNTEEELDNIDLSNSACELVTKENLEESLVSAILIAGKEYNGTEADLDKIVSLIEGTFIYENKFQVKAKEELTTINSLIKKSLQRTFKQDEAQRIISTQIPDGPQRIRGLAGTGKTIVLSLKAAITHKRLPEFKILYLFNTQSLYEHITSLISKYYVSEAKRPPDFDNKMHILHAWGGKQRAGLYSELCAQYGLQPKTWSEVRGASDPLAYIFRDLLKNTKGRLKPIYDMVLIDEAQDLPPEVFETVFQITKNPKRIIWAYDEFQSLRDMRMKEPSDLFGKDDQGVPNISNDKLEGTYAGGIDKDFILPNCYRTPRPVLMTAHGVALGLYRAGPVLQMFDYKADWEAIGYKVILPDKNKLEEHDDVVLERATENSKNVLEPLIIERGNAATDLVNCIHFDRFVEEAQYIAWKINELITVEGVPPSEVLVVTLDTKNAEAQLKQIRNELMNFDIGAVIPGFVESSDVFRVEDKVTLATPFRAKGNESNIVIVANSNKTIQDATLRGRNAFFVAVTRSRGWVYLTGHGNAMTELIAEVDAIKRDFPYFRFTRPTDKEIEQSRQMINISEKELSKLDASFEALKDNPNVLIMQLKNDPELLARIMSELKQ
jgi:superfamily I DNA and RNA helicase